MKQDREIIRQIYNRERDKADKEEDTNKEQETEGEFQKDKRVKQRNAGTEKERKVKE